MAAVPPAPCSTACSISCLAAAVLLCGAGACFVQCSPRPLQVTVQQCKALQLLHCFCTQPPTDAALLPLLVYATCAVHDLPWSPWLHCHNSGAILLPKQCCTSTVRMPWVGLSFISKAVPWRKVAAPCHRWLCHNLDQLLPLLLTRSTGTAATLSCCRPWGAATLP